MNNLILTVQYAAIITSTILVLMCFLSSLSNHGRKHCSFREALVKPDVRVLHVRIVRKLVRRTFTLRA